MPFEIDGWVEVDRLNDPTNEYAWQGVLRVGAIIDTADCVSERLFGLSKRCVAQEFAVNAIAASRGIPIHPSQQVRADLTSIGSHEQEFGSGEFGGFTWANWTQMRDAGIEPAVLAASDWGLLFGLIDRMTQDDRFAPDRIRIIVWYTW